MTRREKFYSAMRRLDDSYVPFEFILCPSLKREFKKRTGREDYENFYDLPARILFPDYTGRKDKFYGYFESVEGLEINDWGIGFKPGRTDDFKMMKHLMKDFESLKEFEEYPYPDPVRDYDWDKLKSQVREVRDRDLIAEGYLEITIFETAWYLRGMDNLMVDMLTDPETAEYLLDRITERRCLSAKMLAEAGCDVLRLGDDVSTQRGMLMSPDLWRQFLKPRLMKVISAAKEVSPDILIFYHGCGDLQEIIPDLIDAGIDILNPVQPECMDPIKIKEEYGDRISFWGTIGTQTTMPFGSVREVEDACNMMIKHVGKGGGLFLAPSHVLEPEVPWDNIEAFVDAVKSFNEKHM